MQIWVILGIVIVVIAGAFAGVLIYRVLHERRVKRAIVWLIGRKEALAAGAESLTRLAVRLSQESDAELARFAVEPDCEDRHAFGDVALRMRIVGEELDHAEIPGELFKVAVDMEVSSKTIQAAAEAAEARGGTDALAGVASLDLRGITELVSATSAELHELAVRHRVDDHSVYGGGLYI